MAVNQWVDGAYYVGADGVMLVSTTTPDGNQVDASGKKIERSRNEKAVEAYRKVLLDRSWNGLGRLGGQFAVVDVNGDGVWELLAQIDVEGYDANVSKIFYFTDQLQQFSLDGIEYWDILMPSTYRLLIDRRRGKYITRVIGFDNKVIEYTDAYIFWYGFYNQDGNITEEIRKKMQQAVETYYTAPCYRIELIDITE